ncbi:hypothetical protein NP493_59g00028 [Ridgeia piscesae]|uniref:Secreted protein n=1 Tax=Ridgeia piscesae TaxID=27915 RepID=A0AAD9PAS7_RIDPI|nr:hypothetical protein NP493_59g00028 [Ridgeia piscesae]
MPFLISWLVAQYCLTPSASFCFFFNSLRLSHRSNKSAVTQGFLTGRCLPRISLAVLVTANGERCKFPSYYCVEGFCYFRVLQLLMVKFDPGVAEFLDPLQISLKVIMTSSWSLPMSAPGKLRVLAMFTLDRKRFLTMM